MSLFLPLKTFGGSPQLYGPGLHFSSYREWPGLSIQPPLSHPFLVPCTMPTLLQFPECTSPLSASRFSTPLFVHPQLPQESPSL